MEFSKNGPMIFIEYFTAPNPVSELNALKQSVNIALMNLVNESGIDMATSTSNITITRSDAESGAPKNNPIL